MKHPTHKLGTSFRYRNVLGKPRLVSEKVYQEKVCKHCGLPRKAPFSSARNLTRFETDTCKVTRVNKSNFDFDRRFEFCNPQTCDGAPSQNRKDYAELQRLASIDLGENYTTAQYVKWRKG